MSYLSGKTIINDYLTYDEELFNREKQEQQIGVDLTVKDIKCIITTEESVEGIYNGKTHLPEYTPFNNDIFNLPTELDGIIIYQLEPNSAYSITFNEGCELDNTVGGFIKGRSSLIRMGCAIESGMYDPGFGVEKMGCIIRTPNYPIIIGKGERVAQLVLSRTEEEIENTYDGQFKGDKDVK